MPQKPRSDSRREALREAARKEERKRSRRRLALWIGASAVAVAVAITAVVLLSRPGVPVAEPTSAVTYPTRLEVMRQDLLTTASFLR